MHSFKRKSSEVLDCDLTNSSLKHKHEDNNPTKDHYKLQGSTKFLFQMTSKDFKSTADYL